VKEFNTIVNAYHKIDFDNQRAAIATVVRVRGSSYRSPGARMLITNDGRWVGSISGGCLEGDALRKARMVMQNKKPIVITYDTREESNQNLGIGLGCNGVIDVLIEAVDPSDPHNSISLFESFIHNKEAAALATIISPEENAGEKLLIDDFGYAIHLFHDKEINNLVRPHLLKVFETRKSEVKLLIQQGKKIEVFIELIQPPVNLIIFGGGFDARPVSELAKSLGWRVQVTDECVAHIAPVFFPGAEKLSLCQREFIDKEFEITPYTACVLMSHNYEYDRDVLRKLLSTPASYIGILGPQKRFNKMIVEFEKENISLPSELKHKIHSPIGLDIGAETPDEIALSIISEIQSKFSNRSGGFLKYSSKPIHHRDLETDQVFKQVYLNPDLESSGTL
jgi:xanthine dehydrogenase accessory factor